MLNKGLYKGYYYHIYNRGVDKRKIFLDDSFYSRFIAIIDHSLKYDYPYSLLMQRLQQARSLEAKKEVIMKLERRRIEPEVEIICFCLMPNHYHLLLRQLRDAGITKFMQRIGIAYTKYFNIRQDRVGRLFESTFKAVMVKSDEQLFHLTRYQHINPKDLGLSKEELFNYSWSSLSTYLGGKTYSFVKPEIVGRDAQDQKRYRDFILAEIGEYEAVRLEDVAIDDDFGWFAEFRQLKKEQRDELRELYLQRLNYV